jgi:peptidoglycan-N-acetylglucosamine deacetylase
MDFQLRILLLATAVVVVACGSSSQTQSPDQRDGPDAGADLLLPDVQDAGKEFHGADAGDAGIELILTDVQDAGTELHLPDVQDAGTELSFPDVQDAGTELHWPDVADAGTDLYWPDVADAGTDLPLSDVHDVGTDLYLVDAVDGAGDLYWAEVSDAGTDLVEEDLEPAELPGVLGKLDCGPGDDGLPCDDNHPLTPDDICLNGICVGIVDPDGDGAPNYGNGPLDNCPLLSNPQQKDSDGDGAGDACSGAVTWWLKFKVDEKVVALTFDDGWSDEHFNGILDALAVHGAYATFFINGGYFNDWAIQPESMTKARKAGHMFGSHTLDHTIGESPEEFLDQLILNEQAHAALGINKLRPAFRSPSFAQADWLNETLASAGYTEHILGNLDPIDWTDPAPLAGPMATCVIENVEPGDIVLFHIGPETTPAALELILDSLSADGYHFLTIEQMLAYGTPTLIAPSGFKDCETYYP